MPTVILKGGRVSVEEQVEVNLLVHRVLDRVVQAQSQAGTKRGRKLRPVLVAQVVLAVVVLKDLARKRVRVLQPRANLFQAWLLSRDGISIVSLARGDREVQVLGPVRQGKGVLQSKGVVVQANPVVVLSKGSPVLRVVPLQRAMIGSLEALLRMSLVSVLQKHRVVTVKLLDLKNLLVGGWEKVFSFVLMWRKSLLRQDFFPCSC
jgi:hypothetical protein